MTVVPPDGGRTIPYGAQVLRFLSDQLDGFALADVVVPARFGGPIPHAHHDFDEALYILDGTLMVTEGHEEIEAGPGSFFLAPRGLRHAFRNPTDNPVRVLGLWSPGPAGLAFMEDVAAALPTAGPPDRAVMAEVYRRHHSDLLP
jgi:mannose-6-phosphate isomerase-like protein (cupin superfamily)